MPISPAVHSHALRWGEMGDSSPATSVVSMLKSKGTLLDAGGCERRGDLGGGDGDGGDVGGEGRESLGIQSVMLRSGSSGEISSVVVASEMVELREGAREKSRTGRWRERGLSFGGRCCVGGLEREGEEGM